jgi:hypothetical protein
MLNGYAKMCCVSPDWEMYNDKSIRKIIEGRCANALGFDDGQIELVWMTDDLDSEHHHLLVNIATVSDDLLERFEDDPFYAWNELDKVAMFMQGLVEGMAYFYHCKDYFEGNVW